ncbi:SDR family oxidoreductase [Stakelama pacifica]|uniref:NAD(P)-dependent dehydrogenase (Short-subunit alcohol dehydrogenase family) n=1 Tax=Stakelama pacifica TaxID=517720 RepID=A0A4V3BS78_9SPHN|nr:SDR family oxidoreductase [Stakelama pacifica]TDN77808.1 NAD(P)-dependent dehydrogenase (short-subunit alcohol dehydrogenase family) [Stakelama pacifica]GGP00758.1 short chain dehydrogenase [Stakelama pacifica]
MDRLALVTGSTRRLGAHIAARLAESGYTLALHASSDAKAEDWLAQRLDEAGRGWACFDADLSKDGAAEALIAAVTRHFGAPPCLLVNNASLFDPGESTPPDMAALDLHFRVNTAGPVLLAQAMARAVGEGSVVNIIDQRVRNPHRDQPAYTLSKQALAEATRLLARMLAPAIRVNAVAPGLTLATEDYDEGQIERLRAMMPLERLPHAEEIADAVLYLAHARSVTGQLLFVDAGASMQSYERDFLHLAR